MSDLPARPRTREEREELQALGFNRDNPVDRLAVKLADHYGLDLLLREVIVIKGRQGARPYITRDGLLSVAHRSGQFDGLEVNEMGEDRTHWTAVVTAYRKDMSHGFRYPGRYPKAGANKEYGPEMALKVAESMALRRAFRVTGIASADENFDLEQTDLAAITDATEPDGIPAGWTDEETEESDDG